MTEQLCDMKKGFESFVTETMEKWNLPGMAVTVVKDGEVILAEGYGTRKVGETSPVTPDTLFAIGSSTKAFAALSIALLVEEGKLAWDKPVRNYMPEFKLFDPIASELMTPLDLLCHRSGLPRHDLVWYNSSASRKEIIQRLQYLEPTQDFRATWQYQNLMYLTAGYLVEHLTGMSWEAFVQERILKPLGMENTNFSVEDSQKSSDFSYPHDKKEEEPVKVIPFRDISTVGPAGSINSSVRDMAKWVQLHLDKGKMGDEELISAQNITEMHTPQMIMPPAAIQMFNCNYPETPSLTYGLGWFVEVYRGRKIIHHGGAIDGFIALVSFMPEENIGMVLLSNINGNPVPAITAYALYDKLLGLEPIDWNERYTEFRAKMKEMMEKNKEQQAADRVADTKPTHLLDAYVGVYEHPGYGQIEVRLCGEELMLTYNRMDFKLNHYHYNSFEAHGDESPMTLLTSFNMDKKGNITKLSVPIEASLGKDIVFNRKEKSCS